MIELHLTKKDFKVDWFSGTGSGGQYRNKHQNCCRITHIETGLRAQATENRERPANQRAAFNRLAQMIVAHYMNGKTKPETNQAVIRNYNESRNEVHDKASGLKMPYKTIIDDIAPMILARAEAMS